MKKLTKDDFTFKTKPLKHQLEALCKSATKQNFAYLMEMGCVDGETEFLSNRGWIKFKDFVLGEWEEPLLVAQVASATYPNPETHQILSFVQPTNYIKKKVNKMYHFTGVVKGSTKPCLDIMVTPEHNMECHLMNRTNTTQNIEKNAADFVTAEDLYEYINTRTEKTPTFLGHSGQALQRCWLSEGPVGYKPDATPLSKLDKWQMRVQVAVMADGSFPHKDRDRCVMEFSKPDKIARFEKLCKKAGIVTVRESCRGGKATKFQLVAPVHKKIYDQDFWLLPPEMQSVIFNEVFHWDGSIESFRYRFYTIHKQSADFIQFLGTIHGYRTSLITGKSNDAPYYTVQLNPKSCLDGNTDEGNYTFITKAEVVEDEQYAYCFRVPSGKLLLRRNDKIFVTGNSGKSKVIIDNMTYLKQQNAIDAAIVLAPKGVYRNWSTQEIPKHMPDEVKGFQFIISFDDCDLYDTFCRANGRPVRAVCSAR